MMVLLMGYRAIGMIFLLILVREVGRRTFMCSPYESCSTYNIAVYCMVTMSSNCP